MPLVASAGWRQTLVAVLYGYQGIVAGFALTALPNYAASLGAGAAELGAYAAMIGTPWVLQPLWGPVVDRFGAWRMGGRRFWVIVALVCSMLALSGLFWLGDARPGALWPIALVFAAHAVFATLMDTAIDAMVIDHTPKDQLGAAVACTRAGFVSGLAVGAGVFGWLLPTLGLAGGAAILLTLGILAAVLPLLVRERAGDALLSLQRSKGSSPALLPLLAELGRGVFRPASLALLLFCVLQDACGAVFRLPLTLHLIQQAGWTAASLSTAQAAIGLAAGTFGAWLAGRWADGRGASHALRWLLVASAAAHLAAGLMLDLGMAWAGPLALALPMITSAMAFVALAPLVMRASRGAVAASRFALFMAALNLGDVLGMAGVGAAVGHGLAPGLATLGALVGLGYLSLAFSAAALTRTLQQPA